jgi:hypothetical protein
MGGGAAPAAFISARTIQSHVRHLLLVLAIFLAGCANPASDETAESHPVPAPTWHAGDRWEYGYSWNNGSASLRQTVRLTVVGEEPYRGTQVYVVNETREDVNGTSRTIRRFETSTLNEMVDFCGERREAFECRWRQAEIDFPLVEGKTWTVRYGVRVHDATLARIDGDAAFITNAFGPAGRTEIAFGLDVKNVVRWEQFANDTLRGASHAFMELRACSPGACRDAAALAARRHEG